MARYSLYMSTLGNRPDCSRSLNMWTNTQSRLLIMKYRENIWTMKLSRPFSPRRKNIWAIPMCGAAAPRKPLLIAAACELCIDEQRPIQYGQTWGARALQHFNPRFQPAAGGFGFLYGYIRHTGRISCGYLRWRGRGRKPRHAALWRPIQYAKLDTSYWQSHFYAYGRLHYN